MPAIVPNARPETESRKSGQAKAQDRPHAPLHAQVLPEAALHQVGSCMFLLTAALIAVFHYACVCLIVCLKRRQWKGSQLCSALELCLS